MDTIPYATQSITEDDVRAVSEVLTSGWLTQGPAVSRFEQAFAARHEVANAVAVSSATAGLHVACLALGAGPGKWVWTSPNSFLASANCARYCGSSVDFVDIDPRSRNMSVPALQAKLEQASREGRLPHIVIPVDFGGLPAELGAMRQLADRYGFRILRDGSHAVGASEHGHPVGSRHADASVFSFHPVKIITTAEGGIVATQDENLAAQLRLLRAHGMSREGGFRFPEQGGGAWYYEQEVLGYNYRLTDLQAALGCSQLERLASLHAARERLAERYDELLRGLPLQLPHRRPDARSSWHLYAVEIEPGPGVAARHEVFARLRAAGIGVNVHYIPIHLQPYYRALGFGPGLFPASERYYTRTLSIPLYPTLSDAQQDRVVEALRKALVA